MRPEPPTVGTIVRRIRKRLGLTTTALGHELGISHSAVSQYEADKVIPREGVLINLLDRSNPGEERSALLKALAIKTGVAGTVRDGLNREYWFYGALAAELHALDRDELLEVDITPQTVGQVIGKEIATILADQGLQAVTAAKLFRLWRRYGRTEAGRLAFAEALEYLQVRLAVLEAQWGERPLRGKSEYTF